MNKKQILIQKDASANSNNLESLTEKDLVAKVNMALYLMGIEAADQPNNTKFIGAKELQNGNVLYQLDTVEVDETTRSPKGLHGTIWRYVTHPKQTFLHSGRVRPHHL